MKHHPYSEIWPLSHGKEFDEIKADIAANGLRVPVLIYNDMILDGRTRALACEQTGVQVRYEQAPVSSDIEALDLAVSLNSRRRHLSMTQRAFAAAQVANLKHGSNQHKKKSEEFAGAKSSSETTTMRQAAAQIGVSYGSAVRAKTILDKGTESDRQEVENGKSTLTAKAETLTKRTPRALKAKSAKRNRPAKNGKQKPPMFCEYDPPKYLKPHEVDPEFTGTPIEFTDKYGHTQVMTALEYATTRFSDWASYISSLAKLARKMPELRNVDHNWLRTPDPKEIAKLKEALDYLRPRIAEAEALLTTAIAAIAKTGAAEVVQPRSSGRARDETARQDCLSLPC